LVPENNAPAGWPTKKRKAALRHSRDRRRLCRRCGNRLRASVRYQYGHCTHWKQSAKSDWKASISVGRI